MVVTSRRPFARWTTCRRSAPRTPRSSGCIAKRGSAREREMFLREQLKAIRKELGEEGEVVEVDELRKQFAELELPEAAKKEVERELQRLERANRDSMEAQVIRTYLETMAELPWNK